LSSSRIIEDQPATRKRPVQAKEVAQAALVPAANRRGIDRASPAFDFLMFWHLPRALSIVMKLDIVPAP
jgi:hypothetical protein